MIDHYAELKTYSDEGVAAADYKGGAPAVRSVQPFSTAFERGGRFRWEFRGSATAAKNLDQQYVVWSSDSKLFESWWDLTKQHQKFEGLEYPMATATGISGGSATAVLPMLRGDGKLSSLWIPEPRDEGKEVIDGAECRKISGGPDISVPGTETRLTLWIDKSLLLRKALMRRDIDPAKLPGGPPNGVKFTVDTTLEFRAKVNEKIPDEAFAAPEMIK
jgi:hypothetical protein